MEDTPLRKKVRALEEQNALLRAEITALNLDNKALQAKNDRLSKESKRHPPLRKKRHAHNDAADQVRTCEVAQEE